MSHEHALPTTLLATESYARLSKCLEETFARQSLREVARPCLDKRQEDTILSRPHPLPDHFVSAMRIMRAWEVIAIGHPQLPEVCRQCYCGAVDCLLQHHVLLP